MNNSTEKIIALLLGIAVLSVGGAILTISSQTEMNLFGEDAIAEELVKQDVSVIDVNGFSMELPEFSVNTSNYPGAQGFYTNGDYIIPSSSERRLDYYDISGFGQEALRYARNEIYARHGRKFKDQDLMSYFMDTGWYIPRYEPDEFPESILSAIEKDNISFIRSNEN